MRIRSVRARSEGHLAVRYLEVASPRIRELSCTAGRKQLGFSSRNALTAAERAHSSLAIVRTQLA